MLIYKTLFEVQVYHDYFLDNGAKKFDSMTPQEKQAQLERYNVSDYLEIIPTPETQQLLVNQRMRLILQSDGFKVVVSTEPGLPTKPVIPLSDAAQMTFAVKIKDTYFNNYTDLELATNRVYLFTNTPQASMPLIPVISNPFTDADLINSTYLASPALTAELLEAFPLEARVGLLGIFTFRMKADATKYDIISGGLIKNPYEAFRIHFVNMKRFWKYKRQNSEPFYTKVKQPLVKNGFIELASDDYIPEQDPITGQYYPNANVLSIEKEKVGEEEVIYSVIFI